MNWDRVERWAEKNTRYVGFLLILTVGVMGVAHAAVL